MFSTFGGTWDWVRRALGALYRISCMVARESAPDALIIGAPKAGTSALHAALAQHPQIYASPVKEPKYYMCWENPPPAYIGPGDAHSNKEWIWRRGERSLSDDSAMGVSATAMSDPS